MKERYSLSEAQEALQVSRSTLEKWIYGRIVEKKRVGGQKELVRALEKQREADDMRQRYLTRAQVEQLAVLHRRQITEATTPDPLTSNLNELYTNVATLKQGQEDLKADVQALKTKVEALEQSQAKGGNSR